VTNFTDAYADLLIKQYWEKPKAYAEISARAAHWETIRDLIEQFGIEFDLDQATGDRLDIIGAIIGLSRFVPDIVPLSKLYFGFADNPNARGFDDRFAVVTDIAPFKDKFEPSYTDLELSDADYRFFIRAKIAKNTGSAYMVSDVNTAIQAVVNSVFEGSAYVVDRQDMTLALYIAPTFATDRLLAIVQLDLLPKPQGVRYADIVQAQPLETFGFSDNPGSIPFGDKDVAGSQIGYFANRVL